MTRLPRLHGVELHEQEWCPATLRNALTEWLRVLWEYSQAHIVIAPLLEKVLLSSNASQIVDLCSGGSGPVIPLQRELVAHGLSIPIVLTDKFPDRDAMTALAASSGGMVQTRHDSVDASSVPADLTGLRTLFNSFHHFRAADARRILLNARISGQPVAIFETTARSAS